MEKDMKFTTAGEWAEDCRWVLGPHGNQKHTAQWVVDNYDGRDDYESNETVQKWIAASKQVLSDSESEERSTLFVGPE